MISYSCEAMKASTASPLGKALEALMQEVIDYRDTKLNTTSMDFRTKVEAIRNFFANKTGPKFIETVYKHTGLRIVKVYFKPHFETCFCTWVCIGKGEMNQRGTIQISTVLNGSADNMITKWFPKEFSVEELMILAKSYDIEKGIIKPEMRKEISQWVKCAMGFDISMGFLLEDYLPKNTGVKYLTAKELTAIVLHEIGHNLNLVEHAADLYARQSKFESLKKAFLKQATTESAINLAKAVAKEAKKCGFDKEADALAGAANRAAGDMKETTTKSVAPQQKGFIMATIGAAFYLLAKVFKDVGAMVFTNPTNEYNHLGQKNKIGDTVISDRMWTWEERKADEYAFSNGYGSYLVTGLEKIGGLYKFIGKSAKDVEYIRKVEAGEAALSLYTKIKLSYYADKMFRDWGFRSYPPGSERYKEILKHTVRGLKEHGASGEYVAKYISDVESIIKSIEEMGNSDKYLEESILWHKAFYKYCSIRSFATWLLDGRVDTELAETLEKIQDLNDNLVTYYGYKFAELSKQAKG